MTKPSVKILSQGFPPETQAGANRIGAMANALHAVSDVHVVTLLPSHPTPEFHQRQRSLDGFDETLPYRVERTQEFHPHRGSFVIRSFREMAMAARLGWRGLRRPPDIYIATSPSAFIGFAGALVSVLRRRPLVIDLRDLTWEYAADEANRRGSSLLRMLSGLLGRAARWSLRRAQSVSVSNQGIRAAVEEFGIPPERIIDAPNGISSQLLARALAVALPSPDPDEFVVTYAGAIGYYQGLTTLLDVAEMMPHVTFRLVGDGPERAALVGEAAARGLTNVALPGYVDRDTLFAHYGESDVLFAQLRNLPVLGRATFPSKPFELMATGRPIVYAGAGITARFLQSSGTTLIAEPENAESIAAAIRQLMNDVDLR